MQVIHEDQRLPVKSIVALITDGTHRLDSFKAGTIFKVIGGRTTGNFTLEYTPSNERYTAIGRTFNKTGFRFRHPYKNELKLCK